MGLTEGQIVCHFHATLLTEDCKFGRILKPAPAPVPARNKAQACDRSLAGTAGSNPASGMDVCLL